MTQKIPAAVADVNWPDLRARYEGNAEFIADIAASAGLSLKGLITEARARGWTLRTARKNKPASGTKDAPAAPAQKPITTTKEAIARLRKLVEARIARLERPEPGSGETVERDVRAANMLARTLEKVLHLEQQQRKLAKLATASRRIDDAWREDIAQRLARLAAGQGFGPGQGPDQAAGQGPADGLAPVGA